MMNDKKIVAVIQARLNSSRFPQKVLCKIGDYSIIEHVIWRVLAVDVCDEVVLAVPHEDRDEFRKVLLYMKPYLSDMNQRRLSLFTDPRVAEDDVLQRVVYAAKSCEADVVVRVTGDCPLWCPGIGNSVIRAFCTKEEPHKVDIVSTMTNVVDDGPAMWGQRCPRSRCPDGTDTEVMLFSTLEDVDYDSHLSPYERQHVTLPIYNNPVYHTEILRYSPYQFPGLGSCFKLSVDTTEDLVNVERVYRSLETTDPSVPLKTAWV